MNNTVKLECTFPEENVANVAKLVAGQILQCSARLQKRQPPCVYDVVELRYGLFLLLYGC